MSAPLVTVCIPTIGRTSLVRQTWESLQRQTLRDIEILVLDNASPEPEREALQALVADDDRVRILRLEERVQVFANFDRGRAAARSEFLTYFHDDDIYEPEFLARHLQMHRRDASIAFSGCNCTYIDGNGRSMGGRDLVPSTAVWPGWRYISTLLKYGRNPMPFSGTFFRRAAVPPGLLSDEYGPHFTDFVMLMRLAETASVGVLHERLVRIRRHPAQASAIAPTRAYALLRDVLFRYLDDLEARGAASPKFLAHARRNVEAAMRRGLLLGWLQTESEAEATACVQALQGGMTWRGTRALLTAINGVGVRLALRAAILPPLLRVIRHA